MYYPYFRARQNELFCLRELLKLNKLSKNITPILEPVKCSKALFDTLRDFIEAGHDIALIHNPEVGQFFSEYKEMLQDIQNEEDKTKAEAMQKRADEYKAILNDKSIITAFINNDELADKIVKGNLDISNCFIINKKEGDCDFYLENGDKFEARMTFIPKDEDFKDEVIGNVSILENCFQKARRIKTI